MTLALTCARGRTRSARSFCSDRLRRARLPFAFPGQQKDQPHAGANGAIGQVKGRKAQLTATPLHDIEIKKIDHLLPENAVEQVSYDAAKNQAKSDLPQKRSGIEMMPAEEK